MNDNNLNNKLRTIQNLLSELANEYDFHFALNFAKFNDNKRLEDEGVLFNEFIDSQTASLFLARMNQLKQNIDLVPNLIKEGKTVVICMNDSNKPVGFDGDWIVKGQLYIVDELVMTKDGKAAYRLLNMKVNPPFDSFLAKRFQRLSLPHQLN